jgi:hypothetical protein
MAAPGSLGDSQLWGEYTENGYKAKKISINEISNIANLKTINKKINWSEAVKSSSDMEVMGIGEDLGTHDITLVAFHESESNENEATFIVNVDGHLIEVTGNKSLDDFEDSLESSSYNVQFWSVIAWSVVVVVVRIAVNIVNKNNAKILASQAAKKAAAEQAARKAAEQAAKKAAIEQAAKEAAIRNAARIPVSNSNVTGHIFKRSSGHLEQNTPSNIRRLESAISDKYYSGKDKFGNDWFFKTEGREQVWVKVYNGKVTDAGVNIPHHPNPVIRQDFHRLDSATRIPQADPKLNISFDYNPEDGSFIIGIGGSF